MRGLARFVATLLCASYTAAHITEVPNAVYQGVSNAEYRSGCSGLDDQKIKPSPNATSYEWWYFDAVSTSSTNESIVIVFYETPPNTFLNSAETVLSVSVTGTFEDGTPFDVTLPVSGSAIIESKADGASGDWQGSGFKFEGSNAMTRYKITGDNPALNISGTFTLQSVAPAHYPCGPNKPGSSEVIIPGVGWSNAVPDSHATVDFTINGRRLVFTGIGYHDKNWGDVPFLEALESWYWGHARLGEYSLVWFDAISSNGQEYVSGYVAHGNEILEGSCTASALKVRPYGANSDFPPHASSGAPTGFTLDFDLGARGKVEANITSALGLIDLGAYERYLGYVTGMVGAEKLTGKGLWEQFKLGP